jgi:hypothetical protein
MSEKADGGPAFPVTDDALLNGMTLRDYFAGQALAGICAGRMKGDLIRKWIDGYAEGQETRAAYAFADAMLKERAKS